MLGNWVFSSLDNHPAICYIKQKGLYHTVSYTHLHLQNRKNRIMEEQILEIQIMDQEVLVQVALAVQENPEAVQELHKLLKQLQWNR